MKGYKLLFVISIILIIAGLGLIVYHMLPLPGRVYTTGVISRVSEDNKPFIRYEEAGLFREKEIKVRGNVNKGDTVKLYYLKKDHKKLISAAPIKEGYLLLIIGILLVPVTFVIKHLYQRKKQIEQDLTLSGDKVYAVLKEIRRTEKMDSNGNHPYFIVCSWVDPATQKEYLFKSREIWFNPSEIINLNNISTFAVYMDKKNRERYYVDINVLNHQT